MNAAALLFGSSPASVLSTSSDTDKVTKTDDFQQVFQTAWQEQKPEKSTSTLAPTPSANSPVSGDSASDSADAVLPTVTLASESELGSLSANPVLQDENSPVLQSSVLLIQTSSAQDLSEPVSPSSTPSLSTPSLSMTDLTAAIFKTTLHAAETVGSAEAETAASVATAEVIDEASGAAAEETADAEGVPPPSTPPSGPQVTAWVSGEIPQEGAPSHHLASALFQNQRADALSLTQGSGFQFRTEASMTLAASSASSLSDSLGGSLADSGVLLPVLLENESSQPLLAHSTSFMGQIMGQINQTNPSGQANNTVHLAFSTVPLPADTLLFSEVLMQRAQGAPATPGSPAALLSEAATQLETRFEVFKQLEQQMYLFRHHQQREIQIQLEPAHLGKLNLRLQQEGHLFQLHITAENAVAKEILDAHIQQLKQQFAQQGFALDRVEVNVHSETSGGFDSETWQDAQGAAFLMPRAEATPFSLLSGGTDDEGSPWLTYASAASAYYYHQVNYFA